MVTIDDVLAAQQVIAGRLHRTPLIGSAALSARIGAPLYLKLESWQKTGSFKPRGVLNKIAALSQAERERGLVTASAGNHAQALAWAAGAEGIACTVVMPETAPAAKLAATQGYGGTIVLEPSTLTVFTRARRRWPPNMATPLFRRLMTQQSSRARARSAWKFWMISPMLARSSCRSAGAG